MARSKADAVCTLVAHLLREKRVSLGLSMYAVARRAAVSHTTLSRIENGRMRPTLDMLLRIAEAMEIRLGPLITEAEASQISPKK